MIAITFQKAYRLCDRLLHNCAARLPLLLLLAFPAIVQAQYTYTTNNGAITITRYTGSDEALTIPSTIDGWPVNVIGNDAFYGCWTLTNVLIPDGVTNLAPSAFYDCINLASVTIPNSVTNIGDSAFQYCASLASITVPDSVTSVGGFAFGFCYGLTHVTIGNSVTGIAGDVFCSCTSLAGVTFGTNVTTIADSAFENCMNLASIAIPSGVTNLGLGNHAFIRCPNLSAIAVDASNSVYSSVDGVLFNKSTNTLVDCPEGKAGSYVVPNSVTNIGIEAFDNCAKLTNITVGDNVSSIGGLAFLNCTNVTRITIPHSVTSIGIEAFYNCPNLASIFIPYSVTNLGNYAFQYCTGLKSVYFEGNAPNTSSNLFSGATLATVYYLPGTTGWTNPWQSRPAVLWNPQPQSGDPAFGVQANQFGFIISGSSNLVVVVEASTNLSNSMWVPVGTNTLDTFVGTNGTSYFSDPDWTNYPDRYYRLRSP